MRLLFLSLLFVSTQTFAGLRHLGVKNLSLEYTAPNGVGSVEKLDVGISKSFYHPIEVLRLEDTLVFKTPVMDLHWLAPWKFLMDAKSLTLTQANVSAGKGKHDFSVASAKLTLSGEFSLQNGIVHCVGTSELPELEDQLLEDCREKMSVEADRLDVPLDLFLIDILSRLPQPEEEEPLKNFTLKMEQGDFYMYFLASYVFKAGLRTWGAMHFEDELKTMVIRVDLIKFGFLPVTGAVMKELQDRVKDPRIEIKPPFIRIRVKE